MQISSLIQKNNRIQIHIDNEYSFSCSMDFVLENQLFRGKEVSKEQIEALSKKSEFDILKSKIMEYIYSKPYSKKEIFNKLDSYSRKKYKTPLDKNRFEEIFEVINQKGYYDSSENINKWVTHYLEKNKGERYIKQKLAQKGYDSKEIIESIKSLENKDNSDEVISSLLTKKLGLNTPVTENLKSKVIRYLLGQGFSYDVVKKAFKKYMEDNNLTEAKEG